MFTRLRLRKWLALRGRLSAQCKDLLRIMLAKEEAERATIDQVLYHAWFK